MTTLKKFIATIITLYIGGFITISMMKKFEKVAKTRFSKGFSSLNEFNQKLHQK